MNPVLIVLGHRFSEVPAGPKTCRLTLNDAPGPLVKLGGFMLQRMKGG
jgi:hypothetical protein